MHGTPIFVCVVFFCLFSFVFRYATYLESLVHSRQPVKQLSVHYNLLCAFHILSDCPKEDPLNRLVSTHIADHYTSDLHCTGNIG